MKRLSRIILTATFVTSASLTSAAALAHNGVDDGHVQTEDRQQKAAEKKASVQARLADKKLEMCRKRETKINSILERIATRGERQMEVFNKIAERTMTFKTSKNLTVTNYDALVADVAAKKAAAQTALTEIKETSVSFDCAGNDPKGVGSSFKEQLKAEIAALKAYKTSVKNLIVGVKSSQGGTSE